MLFLTCAQKVKRPNIIFIMTDDHTKQAMGAYGSIINETPNIDRIANEGMLFQKSFVTNSICAPSRAVALTGKYSHINGLRDNRDEFNGNQMTFPQLLQKAGYQTALLGKWHLKTKPTGFDYWKILPGQGQYYNPKFVEMSGDTVQHEGYVTNLITDFTIEQLKGFDKDRPYCVLFFHKAPHRNWMPDAKHLTMYDDTEIPLPKTFFDDYDTRSLAAKEQDMRVENMFNSFDLKLHTNAGEKDSSGGKKSFDAQKAWANTYSSLTEKQRILWDAAYNPKNAEFKKANLMGEELAKWKYQRYIKDYLRTVASVDDNVGRILDYLDETGEAENTIVIYTSDQGFYLGEHGWYDKRFMYEESLGMPFAVKYPKEIKAGTESGDMIMNLDICPTILDYAGIEIPEEVQGKSIRSILKGEQKTEWRQSVYYHYYEYPHGWHDVKKHYGIRTQTHKLIRFYEIDASELYDLEKDPMEMNNVYGQEEYEKVQLGLEKQLIELKSQYKDI